MAMEMMQLGSRALNHSSASTEAEYDRLRGLARHEASARSSCFDRAHAAYSAGDGGAAHTLSEQGKVHAAKMDAYNLQARDYIFRANNAEGRVAADTIDLHGLYVEEAEDVLEERIRAASARGERHLHVIVGKGNHSQGHVQRIKPRVEQVCNELGLRYETEENEGRIFVQLGGGGGGGGGAGYGHGQGGGAGYPGQQQQHHPAGQQPHHGGGGHGHGQQQHQQHQQQQQNAEVEKLVKKGLKMGIKKGIHALKSCCVVM